jgi:hypothetical protein
VFVFIVGFWWVTSRRLRSGQGRSPASTAPPYGLPSIYSVAGLTFAAPSAGEISCNFFFRKSGSFFLVITGLVLARALVA